MEFTAMGLFLTLGLLPDYRGRREASIAGEVTDGQYETLPLALLRFGRKEKLCLVVSFHASPRAPAVRTAWRGRYSPPNLLRRKLAERSMRSIVPARVKDRRPLKNNAVKGPPRPYVRRGKSKATILWRRNAWRRY